MHEKINTTNQPYTLQLIDNIIELYASGEIDGAQAIAQYNVLGPESKTLTLREFIKSYKRARTGVELGKSASVTVANRENTPDHSSSAA